MTRPGVIAYLLGNKPVLAVAWSLFILNLAAWLQGYDVSLFTVLLSFSIANSTRICHGNVRAYRNWTRDWNALAGDSSRPSVLRRLPWAAMLCAGSLVLGNLPALDRSIKQGLGCVFLGSALWLIVKGARALLRRRRARRAAAQAKQPVEICPSVPRHSPSSADAYRALPTYCRALLDPAAKATA